MTTLTTRPVAALINRLFEAAADAAPLSVPEVEALSPEERGRTIRLRQEPEAAGKKDESIYRYDRAGLLMALKSAAGGKAR